MTAALQLEQRQRRAPVVLGGYRCVWAGRGAEDARRRIEERRAR